MPSILATQSSKVQDNLLISLFISSMKDEIYFESDLNLVLSHANAWQIYVYTSYLAFLNMYDFNKHEKITLIMFTAAVHSWAYNSNYKLNCSKNNTLDHIIY